MQELVWMEFQLLIFGIFILEVFHSFPNQLNNSKDQVQGYLSRNITSNKHNLLIWTMTVSSNAKFSRFDAILCIFEDNEVVIKMIIKDGNPTMRHVSRNHRVALDWLLDRINLDAKIQIKYVVWNIQCGIHNGRTIIVGRVDGRSGHTSRTTVSRNFRPPTHPTAVSNCYLIRNSSSHKCKTAPLQSHTWAKNKSEGRMGGSSCCPLVVMWKMQRGIRNDQTIIDDGKDVRAERKQQRKTWPSLSLQVLQLWTVRLRRKVWEYSKHFVEQIDQVQETWRKKSQTQRRVLIDGEKMLYWTEVQGNLSRQRKSRNTWTIFKSL